MARIRTIKPEFFLDERIAEHLNHTERLLWIGLWCLADSEGRLEDRPKFIKSQIFPYESVNVETALKSLHSAGYIIRYAVDKNYISIKNFLKYQRPYHKEPKSTIPIPVIAASSSGHDRKESAGLLSMDYGLGNGIELKTKSKISLSAEGMFEGISDQQIEVWKKAYPAIDVKVEIGAAGSWAFANPANKKSNWGRFLVNWLKRSQDRAPSKKGFLNGPGSTNDPSEPDWSLIMEHIRRKGTSVKIEGISDRGRTALSKIGGMSFLGMAKSSEMTWIKKDFKTAFMDGA